MTPVVWKKTHGQGQPLRVAPAGWKNAAEKALQHAGQCDGLRGEEVKHAHTRGEQTGHDESPGKAGDTSALVGERVPGWVVKLEENQAAFCIGAASRGGW